jgi:hypothetical protein
MLYVTIPFLTFSVVGKDVSTIQGRNVTVRRSLHHLLVPVELYSAYQCVIFSTWPFLKIIFPNRLLEKRILYLDSGKGDRLAIALNSLKGARFLSTLRVHVNVGMSW